MPSGEGIRRELSGSSLSLSSAVAPDESENDGDNLEGQQKKNRKSPTYPSLPTASGPVFQEILVGAGEQQLFSGSPLRVRRAAEQRFQLGLVDLSGKLRLQCVNSAAHASNDCIDPGIARTGEHKG